MSASPITVLAVDDNVVVRAGLISLLEASDGVQVIGEAGDGAEALEQARRLRPQVVLLDVRMPVRDGPSTVEELSAVTKVVMLTHSEEADIIRTSLSRGAVGYLIHGHFTADELHHALRDVVENDRSALSSAAATVILDDLRSAGTRDWNPGDSTLARLLTEREREIMSAVVRGLNNSSIAQELFLSEKTVKNHLNRIFRKMAVTNRAAAIALWNDSEASTRRRIGESH